MMNANLKKQVASVPVINYKFGTTNACRAIPKFVLSLKMRAPSLDSKQNDGAGLVIRDYSKKNSIWQHKSWKKSGYIGAFDRDRKGNVFIAPMPYVSLSINPPEKQNQIYIIDAKTAEMTLFKKLPSGNPPNAKNPFGVMGLYYDCDTQSLYASTLAGSEPMTEKGVIFQIDLNTGEIVSKFEHTDAIGLAVFNTKAGKKLYFGSARNSSLFSIALDEKGHFTGEKHYELSLSQIKGGDSTIIKKIQFFKKKKRYFMVLKEVEFGFRLLAENNLNKKKYNFELDKNGNQWLFMGLAKD